MKQKACAALRVQLSSATAVVFPAGNFAFGDIIDEADNVIVPVLIKFASDQRLVGDCEVVRFGARDSREPERVASVREIQVVYREATFMLPSSAYKVKCGGFKFGGKTVTSIKQFVRSYEE